MFHKSDISKNMYKSFYPVLPLTKRPIFITCPLKSEEDSGRLLRNASISNPSLMFACRKRNCFINPLKPTGYMMHQQV